MAERQWMPSLCFDVVGDEPLHDHLPEVQEDGAPVSLVSQLASDWDGDHDEEAGPEEGLGLCALFDALLAGDPCASTHAPHGGEWRGQHEELSETEDGGPAKSGPSGPGAVPPASAAAAQNHGHFLAPVVGVVGLPSEMAVDPSWPSSLLALLVRRHLTPVELGFWLSPAAPLPISATMADLLHFPSTVLVVAGVPGHLTPHSLAQLFPAACLVAVARDPATGYGLRLAVLGFP
eukprot:EG_transcript_27489